MKTLLFKYGINIRHHIRSIMLYMLITLICFVLTTFKSSSFLRKQSTCLSVYPDLQDMAKQTIALKVPPMSSDKSRTKAMKIVSLTHGVTGVWVEKEQGKLTVEGEGVDIFALVKTLKKKVGHTDIITVSSGFMTMWS